MTVHICLLKHIFNLIENKIEKIHIRHCMLHYFHSGKSAAGTSRKVFTRPMVSILYLKVRANPGFKSFEVKISTLMTNLAVVDLER